jgi:hypothetical protein
VINSDNLVVKQQQRAGGSEIYNFEDCVVTANERTGMSAKNSNLDLGLKLRCASFDDRKTA